MAELSVVVVGAAELSRRFSLLSAALATNALRRATVAGALIVETLAKQNAPVRTGNLRRSIHTEVLESTRALARVSVGTDVEYARTVEFGSGLYGPRHARYPIVPRTRRALFWPGAAHPVRRVMHPGVQPHPFLIPALRDHVDEIKAEFIAALRAILEAM